MRISDWSSDVCSSDLELERYANLVNEHFAGRDLVNLRQALMQEAADAQAHVNLLLREAAAIAEQADRKSVVEGKSVSVSVDLGGRRIIQKKKHTTDSTGTHHHPFSNSII